MTDQTRTDITLIIDRSGSINRIRDDAAGAIDAFITAQRELDAGDVVRFNLVDFHDEVRTVYWQALLTDVEPYDLRPAGMTALYDAVGSTLDKLGNLYEGMPEGERPAKVLIAIITDGYENSSREYGAQQVKQMITRQSTQFAWEFAYLGVGVDAMQEGANIGIRREGTQSVDHASYGAGGQSLSSYAASYRTTGSAKWGEVDEADKQQ